MTQGIITAFDDSCDNIRNKKYHFEFLNVFTGNLNFWNSPDLYIGRPYGIGQQIPISILLSGKFLLMTILLSMIEREAASGVNGNAKRRH